MATKEGTAHACADNIKASIRSTSTCTNETVTALQELLSRKKEGLGEKENVRVKVQTTTARRRAGTATTPAVGESTKQPSITFAPKERYILATEVANATLKTLADALKNPPSASKPRQPSQPKPTQGDHGRKPARSRTGHAKTASVSQKPLKERPASQLNNSPQKPAMRRRSSSFSSILTSGPDAGLVAIAECARVAFAYLGTPEAARVLGKDTQTLQYENGSLVLIGKLVALGLDGHAIKELRTLKRRLDAYLENSVGKKEREAENAEKENLASLLNFGDIDPKSPALPLIANFQTYALRIIAKLKRPSIIEAAWGYLKLSNPSSPPNLIWHLAQSPNGQAKAARQLESLAQTILALCPSISSGDDTDKLQPSAETVLSLQQLAFKVRSMWWSLVKHQGNREHELWEPFAKCVVAFARRSQLSPAKKYKMAELLSRDLIEHQYDSSKLENALSHAASLSKTLCSLAQGADLPDEALRWLRSPTASSKSEASAAKQAGRLIRIATVSIEAFLKGDEKDGLKEMIKSALGALKGSLAGSASDLSSLFVEVNAMRRAATRLIVAYLSKSAPVPGYALTERLAVVIITSSIHFSGRLIGVKPSGEADSKALLQHNERMAMVRTCLKSMVDSVITCCKQTIVSEDQWKELDTGLEDCARLLYQFEAETNQPADSSLKESELLPSCFVKLSNAYWAQNVQLKRARLDPKYIIAAMQHSIDILTPRSEVDKEAGHLSMKLEQLGEALENLNRGEASRRAFGQCLQSHLSSDLSEMLSQLTARCSVQQIFDNAGPLTGLSRVVKAYHRSFIKFGIQNASELAFYDNMNLQIPARGALLEWQLALYLRTLSRNRQWDANLNGSIVALLERLAEIYEPKKYPLRYLRVSIMFFQISQNHPYTLSGKPSLLFPPTATVSKSEKSEDTALQPFKEHLIALYNLKSSMRELDLPISSIQACFWTWDALISSASSWDALATQVDNIDDWLQDLQACAELLNAKGEEYVALPVIHSLVKLFELQKGSGVSDLVTTLCTLGLQYLRLGYTGKAGLSFAKAEATLQLHDISTEARVNWHIGYAEYLLGIGNGVKCATILADAQSLALADRQFMDLAKPSTTLSGRVRFNRIMADASYVYSLCAAANGSFKEAARHARQSVALNRRIWAAFESRINVQKTNSSDDSESDLDGSSRAAFDPLSSMRNEKGTPLVMSVTHDALCGPEFWCLVPALYRALMQHSQVFAHQGLLHEAIYVAEQAEKVAKATNSPTFITDNASWRADCWAQSGRTDKAETILKSLNHVPTRKSLSVAGYHSALARIHHCKGQFEEEIASYDALAQLLDNLSSPLYIKSLETFSPCVDALAESVANLTMESAEITKGKPGTRGRKPATKTAPRATSRTVAKAPPKPTASSKAKGKAAKQPSGEISSIATQCSILGILQVTIINRGVLANILQGDLAHAFDLLGQAEQLQNGTSQEISHMWAAFKARFAQSIKQIAENFNVNTLPESTIAFPAIGLKERRLSEGPTAKRAVLAPSTSVKGGRTKKQGKTDFLDTLRDARELLVEAHGLSAANGSNHLFQQISSALGHVTILLSAVSGTDLHGSLHPLYAAYMSEIPKCNALRLAQESIEADKEQMSRDECLQWPVPSTSSFSLPPISDFQQKYIDIIPESWTAVSLALSEDRSELYITRFESGLSPFALRLPLARQASREIDEEEFTFEDGKRDFDEIIELSDFSTKTAKDMTSREARQQWWAEREALDARLHELIVNMENIWLGGFKGVFSQHERQPSLLAGFRKSLETILNQHLPSRRKKTQQKQPMLDSRVLELFIGLGDATDEDLDLDEALMDLIYFVVDILQFNGEHNAYDEIDFDVMVVETYDALRAYHSASHKMDALSRHTILILDKNLHGFPWESLPCLERVSVSRLPSLAALRERLVNAQASRVHQDAAPGHYIRTEAGGTSILNPSGDLAHTLKTLQPQLDDLKGPWKHIANRPPSEKEFEDSLQKQQLVLYFGHGSGAQYIKSKTVRRLYSSQEDGDDRKPRCATTLLFGCSSVHLTENGIYEPSGMLSSYLTAGAPAVVGMLWDVTDKDCDRFAIKAGELWGLWPERQDEVSAKTSGKAQAKKAKGKNRVAQLVEEEEGPKEAGNRKKIANMKQQTGDGADPAGDRCRGVGLDEAVKEARKACVLRYLNGAAAVVYGIPVYLE